MGTESADVFGPRLALRLEIATDRRRFERCPLTVVGSLPEKVGVVSW